MAWFHDIVTWIIIFAFIVVIGKFAWEWLQENFLKKKKGGENEWQDTTKKSYQKWKNNQK